MKRYIKDDLIQSALERLNNRSPMRKAYDKYKNNFMNNGGWERGYELLSFEEFKEENEKDEDDY